MATEAQIQVECLKRIKQEIPASVVITNPLSEIQFSGSAKWGKLSRAKSQGWQAGQPDLLIFTPTHSLAIELKTPKADPFRPYNGARGDGTPWLQASQEFEKTEHVYRQMAFLDKLQRHGFNKGFLLCNVEAVLKAIEFTISGYFADAFTPYHFSYGMRSNRTVWIEKK